MCFHRFIDFWRRKLLLIAHLCCHKSCSKWRSTPTTCACQYLIIDNFTVCACAGEQAERAGALLAGAGAGVGAGSQWGSATLPAAALRGDAGGEHASWLDGDHRAGRRQRRGQTHIEQPLSPFICSSTILRLLKYLTPKQRQLCTSLQRLCNTNLRITVSWSLIRFRPRYCSTPSFISTQTSRYNRWRKHTHFYVIASVCHVEWH